MTYVLGILCGIRVLLQGDFGRCKAILRSYLQPGSGQLLEVPSPGWSIWTKEVPGVDASQTR